MLDQTYLYWNSIIVTMKDGLGLKFQLLRCKTHTPSPRQLQALGGEYTSLPIRPRINERPRREAPKPRILFRRNQRGIHPRKQFKGRWRRNESPASTILNTREIADRSSGAAFFPVMRTFPADGCLLLKIPPNPVIFPAAPRNLESNRRVVFASGMRENRYRKSLREVNRPKATSAILHKKFLLFILVS